MSSTDPSTRRSRVGQYCFQAGLTLAGAILAGATRAIVDWLLHILT